MAVLVVVLVLLLAMADRSDAAYCICSSGGDSSFQKNIDYACGAGADCSAINQNGACFNPNTLRDHCNYAVNSYYQRKGQTPGSCDFSGSATVSPTAPNGAPGCVYQSNPNPSGGGSTTPTTNSTVGGTQNISTGSITPTFTPGIGLAPTGIGFGNPDGSSSLLPHITSIFMLLSVSFTLLLSPRI